MELSNDEMEEEYKEVLTKTLTIKNIHKGKGNNTHVIYGTLNEKDTGNLIISATLKYILEMIEKRGYKVDNIK